jgi:ABC-type polysaccharide/polyol phosphate export permease
MLRAFYQDVTYLLGMLLPLLTYLTPILYPASFVPPSLAPWLALNPMAGLVEAYRGIFLRNAFPDPWAFGGALAWGALLILLTYPAYLRRRHLLAEVL